MVTVAARAPVAAGVKLMLIVQLAPGATEPAPVGQVLPAAKAKSAACAPVMVMLVMFRSMSPLLISVRFCSSVVVPSGLLPKALLVAESVAVGGVTPVPVSDTDCGLPGASLATPTLALLTPVDAGWNLTPMLQFAPGTREVAAVQSVPTVGTARTKSPGFGPVNVMLVNVRGSVPVLLNCTFDTALALPTATLPKAKLVGLNVTTPPAPMGPVR